MAHYTRAYGPGTGRYETFRRQIQAETVDAPYDPSEAERRYGLRTERGYRNRMQREYDDRIADLRAVEDAPVIDDADIVLDWNRGGQYRATVDYRYTNPDGSSGGRSVQGRRTGGQGYDRMSTALSNTFNADPALRRIAYDAVADGRVRTDDPDPFGRHGAIGDDGSGASWRWGVGMGPYAQSLDDSDYDLEYVGGDDRSETYRIRRKRFRSAARRLVLPDGAGKGNRA